jgi:phage gp29-like protein
MHDYVQLNSGLVVPEPVFAAAMNIRPELREIATTQDGRDITRGYVDSLPLLQPQDQVLLARGGGNYLLYEELRRDDQVGALMAQRQLAVTSREWEVIPGGTDRKSIKAADSLRAMLDDLGGPTSGELAGVPLSGWDSVTAKMLWGRFYGYSVAEAIWGRDGREVTLEAVKVRNRRRFAFAPDYSLRLLTTRHQLGEELPDRKFWAFSVGSDNDDEPYGLGLAHWLYWPVLFKRNGVKFWLIFLEKFGQPVASGKFPVNATQAERARLLAAVQAIQTDSGIILPQGMDIELIEAARSGSADYHAMIGYMNQMIAKVILGQVMTSEPVGGQYKSEIQMDVRQDLVKADADLICSSFNQTIGHWLTDWNYPGAEYPKVWRKVDAQPDLKTMAEKDRIIVDMGFSPSLDYIRETYGEGWDQAAPNSPPVEEMPTKTEVVSSPNVIPAQDTQPAFAAPTQPATDHIDTLIDEAMNDWEEVMEPMLDPLRQALAEAIANNETAEQLLARLPAALLQMSADQLADSLTRAAVIARAAGLGDLDLGQGD